MFKALLKGLEALSLLAKTMVTCQVRLDVIDVVGVFSLCFRCRRRRRSFLCFGFRV